MARDPYRIHAEWIRTPVVVSVVGGIEREFFMTRHDRGSATSHQTLIHRLSTQNHECTRTGTHWERCCRSLLVVLLPLPSTDKYTLGGAALTNV